jgi:hypothetical protein
MWITPLPPPLTALGKGSHGSVLSEKKLCAHPAQFWVKINSLLLWRWKG